MSTSTSALLLFYWRTSRAILLQVQQHTNNIEDLKTQKPYPPTFHQSILTQNTNMECSKIRKKVANLASCIAFITGKQSILLKFILRI